MDDDNLKDEGQSLDDELPVSATESKQTAGGPAPYKLDRYIFTARTHWKTLAILIISMLLLILATAFITSSILNKKSSKTVVINTQTLSNGTLNKVTSKLGKGAQTTQLTITPDTIFKNNVEIQGTSATDGNSSVNGNLNVKGESFFNGQITASGGLIVHGSGTYDGNLVVSGLITASSLSVGSLNIGALSMTGDLNIGGHFVPTGNSPTVTPSTAAANGSVSISGDDTSGTVTINVGSGKTIAGEMAIITFRKAYATTPKVQLTPVNLAAAQTSYFVSQSPTFFTVNTAAIPSTGTSYSFNYFVTQ